VAEIEVVSPGISGMVHSYEVMIDGQKRGSVKSGETRIFPVVPGIHTVRVVTARTSPPAVKVVVSGTTSLMCQTRPKLRFGLFPTGEPETQIVVREREEIVAREGGITWRAPANDSASLDEGNEALLYEAGDAPQHDMLAAD
jgi:hypothetical protein